MSAALRARGSWHVSAAVGVWGHGGPGTCLRPCGQGGPGTCLRLYSPVPGGTGALARVCGSGGMRRGTLADCCLALSGTGVLARVSGSAARRRGKKCQLFSRTVLRSTRKKVWTVFRCVTSQCLQSSGAAAKTAVPFCPQRLVSLPRPRRRRRRRGRHRRRSRRRCRPALCRHLHCRRGFRGEGCSALVVSSGPHVYCHVLKINENTSISKRFYFSPWGVQNHCFFSERRLQSRSFRPVFPESR